MSNLTEVTLPMLREHVDSAVLSDALDSLGFTRQVPSLELRPMTGCAKIVGRARTTLWADMFHVDPQPYELELRAVDACQADDVLIAAAGGSNRSGIWGELLSTAAKNRGCVGAVVDGMVRDVDKMTDMNFAVFARGTNCRDSQNRQRVVDLDVTVDIGGVTVHTGDLVLIDLDGMVVVPQEVEREALSRAWNKIHAENVTRDAIRGGMKAMDAWKKYGVL
ncbi:MAG: RraA family protein [Planctomycetaceae bacterium]|nr:RraA family protein [Planctomycetaceae bacterium]